MHCRCRRGRPPCKPRCATRPSCCGCSSCRRQRSARRRTSTFPLLVPRGFVARMRKGDPHDPLLRQVWPHAAELDDASPASRPIPSASKGSRRPGVIQKYPRPRAADRERRLPAALPLLFPARVPVLGAARGARRLVRGGRRAARRSRCARSDLERRRSALASRTGASASSSRDSRTRAVTTVRIHTRFPIAMPERVDDGLLRVLRGTPLQTVLVVHANHANELDAERRARAADAARRG